MSEGPSDVPASQSELRRLGDFEIVRELGRGEMGVVYQARQLSLNRKVALKVLSAELGLTPKAVEHFHREAIAARKLRHTNIVPLYMTGQQDGTRFYAMELIEGPSLDEVIRHSRQSARKDLVTPRASAADGQAATGAYVPSGTSVKGAGTLLTSSSFHSDSHYFDTVATMIAGVADALDYAHKQGVIHGDIKPSNLMLSPDGRLEINDFGLARMLEQPGMTLTGKFVGTPRYLSPEQIAVGRLPLDHRTDIYSLGATLYELLTLQPPFTGERRDPLLAQIMHQEPKPPRRLNRKVPVDLETICLKALDKDPDRRYQTAGAMAEDLRRYVKRCAIAARRTGPIRKAYKWVVRHPALAATLAGLLLLLGIERFFAIQAQIAENRRLELAKLHTKMEIAVQHEKWDEVEPLIHACLALQEKLGWGNPESLELLHYVGYAYGRMKQFDKAIASYERLLKLEEAKYGRQNPATHRTVMILATNYAENGRLKEAIPLLEEAVRGMQKGPYFDGVVNSLLDALQRVDDATAARHLSAVLPSVRAVFGENHSLTLRVMDNLGYGLARSRQFTDAEAMLKETIEREVRALGQEDMLLLQTRTNLGELYQLQGRHAKAEELLRQCLLQRTKKEPNSFRLASTQSMLGRVQAQEKKFAEAESLLLAGHKGLKDNDSTTPIWGKYYLPDTELWLAELYEAWGKPDEAKKWRGERAKYPEAKKAAVTEKR
jgi:serine/threonine protein kinase/Flp pilus assembly protein TadD